MTVRKPRPKKILWNLRASVVEEFAVLELGAGIVRALNPGEAQALSVWLEQYANWSDG